MTDCVAAHQHGQTAPNIAPGVCFPSETSQWDLLCTKTHPSLFYILLRRQRPCCGTIHPSKLACICFTSLQGEILTEKWDMRNVSQRERERESNYFGYSSWICSSQRIRLRSKLVSTVKKKKIRRREGICEEKGKQTAKWGNEEVKGRATGRAQGRYQWSYRSAVLSPSSPIYTHH